MVIEQLLLGLSFCAILVAGLAAWATRLRGQRRDEYVRCVAPRGRIDPKVLVYLQELEGKTFHIETAMTPVIWGVFAYFRTTKGRFRRGPARIVRAPGSIILEILEFFVPRKLYREVYCQVIADTRDEIFEHLREGRVHHARMAHVRMYLGVVVVTILLIPPRLWGVFKASK